MSLHAQLSPEAQVRLEVQQRNSTISSLAITVLSILLLGLTLGYILLDGVFKETRPDIFVSSGPKDPDPPLDAPKVPLSLERKPSAPSAARNPMIVSPLSATVSIPTVDLPVSEPTAYFGDGDGDFGRGGIIGTGPGDFVPGLPQDLNKRCMKQDRLARLQSTGGTVACEEAVEKALQWLKSSQSKEGNWPGNVSNTGFALLVYLGRCETPLSEEYGESCLRAIIYLVDLGMKNKGGWLTTSPNPATNKQIAYEHAINTYALAEATTFCKLLQKEGMVAIPNLEEVTQRAGQLIIDNQTSQGGWEYHYAETSTRGGGDLSITAWQIQALKACKHTGIDFRNLTPCVRRAMDYIEGLAGSNGGFGYSSPGKGHTDYNTLTGAGMLCLQIWDKGSRSAVRNGARYVDANTKFDYNTRYADLYGHYYEAQAMLNRGGEQWNRYNKLFRDQLLDNQNPDGSWKVPGGGGKDLRAVAPAYLQDATYRTCLCTLMLEVYYRFLPSTDTPH
ncbi:MAG: terpene cyclase/mutase family protein [Akkermansiaceae bacterium]|nr:terpene cyclase/mutase family protein [Akkermansiaceae bacterium]MCF7734575.1 terpene cyclase/mutase family protein [Akkermansiaceae bacterium]